MKTSRWLPVLLLTGCAGEPPVEEELVTTTQLVRAENGGEVVLEDGARLVFEPGALGEDSEVVFSRSACTGAYAHPMFGTCRYEVAGLPSGEHPRYQLLLPRTSPEGEPVLRKRASQGYASLLDSNATAELISATGVGPAVFAGVSTLGTVEDSRFADLVFTACGGDLLGTWELDHTCGATSDILGTYSSGGNDPYDVCSDTEVFIDEPFSVDGSVSFTMRSDDVGELEVRSSHKQWEVSIVAQSCLDRAKLPCGDACVDEEGLCVCTYLESQGTDAMGDFWGYGDEGEFVFTSESPTSSEPTRPGGRYCVDGDELTIEYPGRNGAPYYLRYRRN